MTTVSELVGRVSAEGVDTYVSEMQRVGSSTDDAGGQADSALSRLGGSMQNLGGRMQEVGGKLTKTVTGPMLAVGGALTALGVKTGNYADRILDLSAITGMSTDAIQEYQHVARLAGVETEAVTHATEGLVRRIPMIASEGGRAAEAFDELGVSLHDASGEMRSGEDIMDDLINQLAGMDDEVQRNALGSQIFGGAWKDMAPILAMGADGISDARGEAHELGAVMSGEALESANEMRMEWERVKTQAASLGRELGVKVAKVLKSDVFPAIQKYVIPALQRMGGAIGRVIDWYRNLSPSMRTVVNGFVGFAVAIGPVLAVVGTVITTLGAVAAAAGALGVGLGALAAIFLGIPAIIAAVVTAGVLLWKNWDTVKEKLAAAWDAIQKGVASAMKWIVAQLKRFGPTVLAVLTGPIGIAVLLIARHWASIRRGLSSAWNAIRGAAASAAAGVRSAITTAIGAVVGAVANVWRRVSGGVRSAFATIRGAAVSGARSVVNGVGQALGSLVGKLAGVGRDAGAALGNAIRAAVNGVLDRIRSIKIGGFSIPGTDRSAPSVTPFSGLPRLARGGLAHGPTLAMVGDNPGARIDPEVIAPLSKLERMLERSQAPVDQRPHVGQIIVNPSPGMSEMELAYKIERMARRGAVA